jgi:hypothetical protein
VEVRCDHCGGCQGEGLCWAFLAFRAVANQHHAVYGRSAAAARRSVRDVVRMRWRALTSNSRVPTKPARGCGRRRRASSRPRSATGSPSPQPPDGYVLPRWPGSRHGPRTRRWSRTGVSRRRRTPRTAAAPAVWPVPDTRRCPRRPPRRPVLRRLPPSQHWRRTATAVRSRSQAFVAVGHRDRVGSPVAAHRVH